MKKLLISFTDGQLSEIDDYRAHMRPVPSRNAAIRDLIDSGLLAWLNDPGPSESEAGEMLSEEKSNDE